MRIFSRALVAFNYIVDRGAGKRLHTNRQRQPEERLKPKCFRGSIGRHTRARRAMEIRATYTAVYCRRLALSDQQRDKEDESTMPSWSLTTHTRCRGRCNMCQMIQTPDRQRAFRDSKRVSAAAALTADGRAAAASFSHLQPARKRWCGVRCADRGPKALVLSASLLPPPGSLRSCALQWQEDGVTELCRL